MSISCSFIIRFIHSWVNIIQDLIIRERNLVPNVHAVKDKAFEFELLDLVYLSFMINLSQFYFIY